MKAPQQKAVSYFLSRCRGLPIVSILTYGSFGRGDYKPSSDVDVLVVVDSSRYCKKDLISLMKILEDCKARSHVGMDMDIILDSDIDLWNNGILPDGHHFSHLSTNYNRDAKVLFGEDIRRRFRLPSDFEKKALLNLKNIEAEYLAWFLHYYHYHTKDDPYYDSVP
jgi:predicted nucleotidyltransferase